MPTSLCLNMIVKNEAHVIRRCLDSVRRFISHWVIVDTGSSDGTQAVIRQHFADVPGVLH
jgi:glycosyltransferase involved in cell wall biosynthesis